MIVQWTVIARLVMFSRDPICNRLSGSHHWLRPSATCCLADHLITFAPTQQPHRSSPANLSSPSTGRRRASPTLALSKVPPPPPRPPALCRPRPLTATNRWTNLLPTYRAAGDDQTLTRLSPLVEAKTPAPALARQSRDVTRTQPSYIRVCVVQLCPMHSQPLSL